MRRGILLSGLVAFAAVPAVALSAGSGRYISYTEHPRSNGKVSNTHITVERATGRTFIHASDKCLGTSGGRIKEASIGGLRGPKVHDGKLDYDGNAFIDEQQGKTRVTTTVTLKMAATVTAEEVTGTVDFPATAGCKARSFTAKRISP